ncbi:hypothetical protein C9374_011418 [Naegleria lovaniensis]|uniref:Glycosyl transferase family 1 domain-containing protein n=1 Tax=Naegleria lovaniensis TaxID=51637 RepID=A0AA88KP13_NAELO|nr:uncharacterized protein C9374_011418 [Naegleria lovaniensis]KAG2392693.1 hypothetical protein C9374_011418 [Naegleria lovaniensis]
MMINTLVNRAHSSLMPLLRKRVLFFVVLTLGILMFIQVILFKSYLSNKNHQHSAKLNLPNSEILTQADNSNTGTPMALQHTDTASPIDAEEEASPIISRDSQLSSKPISERHLDNNIDRSDSSANIRKRASNKKQAQRIPSANSGSESTRSSITIDSNESVKPKKEPKKPTTIPTVHYLFICDSNINNKCASDEEWVSKIKNQVPNDVKMQKTDSSLETNADMKVNFVLFSNKDQPPSQLKDDDLSKQLQFVKIKENNIPKTVNNYVQEFVKDDYDMIIFIHGNAIPIAFSYYQTWDMLDEMDQVGSITVLSKTAKTKTVGWNIRARSCDGKSKAFSLVKHLAGYDVTMFSDYSLNKKGNPKHAKSRFDDDIDIFLPDFTGLSMLKKTFTSVQGFNENLKKDYALDLMLKVSKSSFSSLFSLNNVIQSFDPSGEDEEIVFSENEVQRCDSSSPSSVRPIENSLNSLYYETVMNIFNDRLFLRNVELIYTITSLDTATVREAVTNLAGLEGKVMITLKAQDENKAISLLSKHVNIPTPFRSAINRIESMASINSQSTTSSSSNQKIYFYHGNPPQFSCPTGSSLCIGKTQVISSGETKIPTEWVKSCNSAVDQVWVSSKFAFEALRGAGVKKKKLVFVPTGVDTKLLRPRFKLSNSKATTDTTFKFLTILDWNNKKSARDVLLKAFIDAFSANDKVILTIKPMRPLQARVNSQQLLQEAFRSLNVTKKDENTRPRIELLSVDVPTEKMPEFYQRFDGLVMPGEIESQEQLSTLLEAMASGLITIASESIDTLDFMNEANSFLLPSVSTTPDSEASAYLSETLSYILNNRNQLETATVNKARFDMLDFYDQSTVIREWLERMEPSIDDDLGFEESSTDSTTTTTALSSFREDDFADQTTLPTNDNHQEQVTAKKKNKKNKNTTPIQEENHQTDNTESNHPNSNNNHHVITTPH